MIIVRDLAEGSHGNALGMGLADIITRRLFKKINFRATYENVITSTFLERGKVPIIAENDLEAIDIALRACAIDAREASIIRIRNTLRLDTLLVSPVVAEEIEGRHSIQIAGPVSEVFDGNGSFVDFAFPDSS